jgi:glycerate kinase
VLLTGEGRFDATSLRGKVVGAALAATSARVIGVIAGSLELDPGCWSASLTGLAGSPTRAMAEPERWLREAGARAAQQL